MAPREPTQVVLLYANVIYARVLRDYLVYSADAGVIAVAWSTRILEEATSHLASNIESFTDDSAQRLIAALNTAYPESNFDPQPEHFAPLAGLEIPDEDDRHVLAAAIAAGAEAICTANVKDFPGFLWERLNLVVEAPDALLSRLICSRPEKMIEAHRLLVGNNKAATDETTVAALLKVGAAKSAEALAALLAGHC